MSVSYKVFLACVSSATSLLLAVALRVCAPPVWMAFVLVAPLLAGIGWASHEAMMRSPRWVELALHKRRLMARCTLAAVAAHGIWLGVGVVDQALGWQLLLSLAALTAVEIGVAKGLEYFLTALPEPVPAEVALAARPAGTVQVIEAVRTFETAEAVFEAALDAAGYGYLELLGEGDGFGAGMRFHVRVPSRLALAASPDAKKSGIKALTRDSAEEIAIALNEISGSRLMTDWVKVRKEPMAGEWSITVTTRDVMAEVVPYVDSPGWTTIREEAFIGLEVDGTPVTLNLAQHGQVIGKSRSGKTSLLNTALAHVTRCEDAILWVCGVEKLYDTLGPWLQPYAGSDERVPFDWVAYGQEDSLAMMVAAMQVARYRQSLPYGQREDWPRLIVVLDEASFFLKNRTVKLPYQGVHYNASEMFAMGTQGAGSAGVHFVPATQRGTNGQMGDEGGNVKANIGWTAVFKSQDPAEVGRATGDYKLPPLRHSGQFYLVADGGPVRQVKAPYIQEIDPARPRLHNGPTVADVSWSRRGLVKSLDEGSQRAAGEAYAARHRRANDLITYLTSAPVQRQAPRSASDQLLDAEAEAFAALEAAPRPVEAVVDEVAATKSRREHILEIVEDLGTANVADIMDKLRERGDEFRDRQVVDNALSKLVNAGTLARLDKGVYAVA